LFASAQKNSTLKNPARYSISDSPASILNNASSVMLGGAGGYHHAKHQSLLSPGGAIQLNRENSLNGRQGSNPSEITDRNPMMR